MDASHTITLALIVAWALVLSCVAAGAVLYHWPADFGGRTRRGFDVLPARPAPTDGDVTVAR